MAVPPAQHCLATPEFRVTSSTVFYVAGVLARGAGRHPQPCLWRFTLAAGWRYNVTLYDFATSERTLLHPRAPSCDAYVTVTDMRSEPVRVCRGAERQRVVFMSRGRRLEIRTADSDDGATNDDRPHYLLKIEGRSNTAYTHNTHSRII